MSFETKDSGKREEYKSGMVRDTREGKARFDLVDIPMLRRWAELMGRGAVKYGENNWRLACSQEEYKRFIESAFRHFIDWKEGKQDEDHAAAVLFNIAAAEYVKQRLDNLTEYNPNKILIPLEQLNFEYTPSPQTSRTDG